MSPVTYPFPRFLLPIAALESIKFRQCLLNKTHISQVMVAKSLIAWFCFACLQFYVQFKKYHNFYLSMTLIPIVARTLLCTTRRDSSRVEHSCCSQEFKPRSCDGLAKPKIYIYIQVKTAPLPKRSTFKRAFSDITLKAEDPFPTECQYVREPSFLQS